MKSLLSGGIRVTLGLAIILMLSACSGVNKAPSAGMSVLDYYQQGLDQLLQEDTAAAAKTLDEMGTKYPFNAETGDLYVSLMDSYYRNNEPDKLIELVDRFIGMYPSHKDVAYANYIAGVANYDRGKYKLSLNNEAPDSTYAEMALKHFYALLKCCDNTRYAFEAKQHIAQLESMVALYHLRYMEWDYDAGRLPQATQRGKSIVSTYPNTFAAKRAGELLFSMTGVNPLPVSEPVVEPVIVAEPVVVVPVVEEPSPAPEPEKFYTLQLGTFTVFDRLVKVVDAMGLEGLVVYYSYVVKGKTYYIATYGKYETRDQAKLGIEEVRKITGKQGFEYWLRQLDSSKFVALQ